MFLLAHKQFPNAYVSDLNNIVQFYSVIWCSLAFCLCVVVGCYCETIKKRLGSLEPTLYRPIRLQRSNRIDNKCQFNEITCDCAIGKFKNKFQSKFEQFWCFIYIWIRDSFQYVQHYDHLCASIDFPSTLTQIIVSNCIGAFKWNSIKWIVFTSIQINWPDYDISISTNLWCFV